MLAVKKFSQHSQRPLYNFIALTIEAQFVFLSVQKTENFYFAMLVRMTTQVLAGVKS